MQGQGRCGNDGYGLQVGGILQLQTELRTARDQKELPWRAFVV